MCRYTGVGWQKKIDEAQQRAIDEMSSYASEPFRINRRQEVKDALFPSLYFSGCNDHKVALDATWIAKAFKKIELDHMRLAMERDAPGGGPFLRDGVPGFALLFGRASHEFPFQLIFSPHNTMSRGFVLGTSQVVPT